MTLAAQAGNAEDSCLKNQPLQGPAPVKKEDEAHRHRGRESTSESVRSVILANDDIGDLEKGTSSPTSSSSSNSKESFTEEEDSPSGNNNYGSNLNGAPLNSSSTNNNYEKNALERSPSAATSLSFPEGGLQGWLVVFGSFCAMVMVFGLINSSAVFESYFSTHQLAGHSSSEIGWIFSLYLFIVFFVGIQVGPVFDRYGARLLVAAGSIIVILSLMLLSLCESKFTNWNPSR